MNLWPDDVHTPWVPSEERLSGYPNGPADQRKFSAVLDEYDRQLGRLMAGIKELGLDEQTLVIFSSEKGALPTFRGLRSGGLRSGGLRSGGLRGSKLSLYEGGIRMPLVVRWPGHVPAGKVDEKTVISAVDLFPSLCALAGAALPRDVAFDGEDSSGCLLGKPATGAKPLFWEYGRNEKFFAYPQRRDRSPNVAVREGKWKLLINADASGMELYDMDADPKETTDVASFHAEIARRLSDQALAWRRSLPTLE